MIRNILLILLSLAHGAAIAGPASVPNACEDAAIRELRLIGGLGRPALSDDERLALVDLFAELGEFMGSVLAQSRMSMLFRLPAWKSEQAWRLDLLKHLLSDSSLARSLEAAGELSHFAALTAKSLRGYELISAAKEILAQKNVPGTDDLEAELASSLLPDAAFEALDPRLLLAPEEVAALNDQDELKVLSAKILGDPVGMRSEHTARKIFDLLRINISLPKLQKRYLTENITRLYRDLGADFKIGVFHEKGDDLVLCAEKGCTFFWVFGSDADGAKLYWASEWGFDMRRDWRSADVLVEAKPLLKAEAK